MTTGVKLLQINIPRIKGIRNTQQTPGMHQYEQQQLQYAIEPPSQLLQSVPVPQQSGQSNLIPLEYVQANLANVSMNPVQNYNLNALKPSNNSPLIPNYEKKYDEQEQLKNFSKFFSNYFEEKIDNNLKNKLLEVMNFIQQNKPPANELKEFVNKQNFYNYFIYLNNYINIYKDIIINKIDSQIKIINIIDEKIKELLLKIGDNDEIDIYDLNLNGIPFLDEYWIRKNIQGVKFKGDKFKEIIENFKTTLNFENDKKTLDRQKTETKNFEDLIKVITYDKFINYVEEEEEKNK